MESLRFGFGFRASGFRTHVMSLMSLMSLMALRFGLADTGKMLGRQLARWAKDNFKAIAAYDPVMPPAAYIH